jgi:precorrin-2 dehydrogenase/sirohydrochlorin ferrochelatase
MPQHYPVLLNIAGRRCLIVGGGAVAVRKAAGLAEAGALLRVVAPQVRAELDALPGAEILRTRYAPEHLAGCALAFAATDDPAVNAAVAADARAAGVLCNVADDPDAGDFLVPSVLRTGPVTVSVSTGGASPALAARLRRILKTALPEGTGELAERLAAWRKVAHAEVADPAARRELLLSLGSAEALDRWAAEGPDGFDRWVRSRLNPGDEG